MTTPAPHLDVVRTALSAEYDVLEEIGRGGMAIVYRAVERAGGREVAIKVLPAQFAFDEGFVERFQREGRIAAQLEHPYIVPVYHVGRSGHVIYFVMKLFRGDSLGQRLATQHRLPVAETRRMLVEAASALGYAAARGVVHRDIKPDNIMFDDDGRSVVADFGIARSASESRLTATGISVGTPRYMSPEQARAKPLDGRSDIYSLGIVAYECLVGDTPFHGDDAFAVLMEHIRAPLPRPALGSAEEWDLFDVVERMLAKDPDDRFQTADELIAALGGVRSDTGRQVAWSPRPPGALTPTRPARAIRKVSATRQRVASAVDAGLAYAGSRAPRFWIATATMAATLVAGYYGAHFATKHRSHCPRITVAGDSAGVEVPRAKPFAVLLDAVGSQSVGDDLDLYYDVCGLAPGTTYTTSLRAHQNSSGLKRLLGRAPDPVTLSYDEEAAGPAVRRHRSIDFGEMPAGSYTVDLVVTDAAGRTRQKMTTFQIVR